MTTPADLPGFQGLLATARACYGAADRPAPSAVVDQLAAEYPEELRALVGTFTGYSDFTVSVALSGMLRARWADARWIGGIVTELRKRYQTKPG